MILFFDTETTGKADFKSPPDLPHQPRIVQLAAILADHDGAELASINLIIQPVGFEIPSGAASIHGITTEKAEACGVPVLHAMLTFSSLAKTSSGYCCHNSDFDLFMVDGECDRISIEVPSRPAFCTMKEMTEVCQLPGPYGFKWPRLQEAYKHAFGREFSGAHDALADVRACKEVYFWLKSKSPTSPANTTPNTNP